MSSYANHDDMAGEEASTVRLGSFGTDMATPYIAAPSDLNDPAVAEALIAMNAELGQPIQAETVSPEMLHVNPGLDSHGYSDLAMATIEAGEMATTPGLTPDFVPTSTFDAPGTVDFSPLQDPQELCTPQTGMNVDDSLYLLSTDAAPMSNDGMNSAVYDFSASKDFDTWNCHDFIPDAGSAQLPCPQADFTLYNTAYVDTCYDNFDANDALPTSNDSTPDPWMTPNTTPDLCSDIPVDLLPNYGGVPCYTSPSNNGSAIETPAPQDQLLQFEYTPMEQAATAQSFAKQAPTVLTPAKLHKYANILADADSRRIASSEKMRDASITILTHLPQEMPVTSPQKSAPVQAAAASTPERTFSASTQSSNGSNAAPASGPVELVMDLNMNPPMQAALPRRHKPRTKEQRKQYLEMRQRGACEKHRKLHKRCTCIDWDNEASAGTVAVSSGVKKASTNKSAKTAGRSRQSSTSTADRQQQQRQQVVAPMTQQGLCPSPLRQPPRDPQAPSASRLFSPAPLLASSLTATATHSGGIESPGIYVSPERENHTSWNIPQAERAQESFIRRQSNRNPGPTMANDESTRSFMDSIAGDIAETRPQFSRAAYQRSPRSTVGHPRRGSSETEIQNQSAVLRPWASGEEPQSSLSTFHPNTGIRNTIAPHHFQSDSHRNQVEQTQVTPAGTRPSTSHQTSSALADPALQAVNRNVSKSGGDVQSSPVSSLSLCISLYALYQLFFSLFSTFSFSSTSTLLPFLALLCVQSLSTHPVSVSKWCLISASIPSPRSKPDQQRQGGIQNLTPWLTSLARHQHARFISFVTNNRAARFTFPLSIACQ